MSLSATALLLALSAWAAPLQPPPLPGEPLVGWEALAPAPAPELSVEDAVRIALERNGDLQQVLASVDVARGARRAAGSLPNPTTELVLFADGRTGLEEVEVELPITRSLLAPVLARPARAELDRARMEATAAQVRFAYDVRSAYFAAQAAEARYTAAVHGLDAWAASAETARALFAAGNVPELDVAIQEGEYERARIEVARLELEVLRARERLSRWMGGPEGRALTPLATAPARSLPADLEDLAVEASLELGALDAAVASATATLVAARLQGLVPDLEGFVAASPDEGLEVAGVRMELPLFAQGTGRSLSARAARGGLQAARDQRQVDVRSSARELAGWWTSAHDRAEHYRTVVLPARTRVSRQALLQYNAMQVSVFALLDARRQELDARAEYAELLAEAWTAEAALSALLEGVRVDAPVSRPTANVEASASGGH